MLKLICKCNKHPEYSGKEAPAEPCMACSELFQLRSETDAEPDGVMRHTFEDGSDLVGSYEDEPVSSSYTGPLSKEAQTVKGAVSTLVLLIALLVGAGVAVAQQPRTQTVYKTFRITSSDVGVACRNGAPPQVKHNAGDSIVVVSCEN